LVAPEPDAEKAENYFKRALAVARQQQAKSGNCALRRVWRGSGAIRVSGRKSRPSRSGLWLVLRRVWHARS